MTRRLAAFAALAVAAALVMAAALVATAPRALAAEYRCAVTGVVDGDTIRVPSGCLPREPRISIRLRGIDTPEIKGKCEAERDLARRAAALTRHLIEGASEVLIENPVPDKYAGRRVADVVLVLASGERRSLSAALIEAGLARPYSGRGKRQGWCP